MGMGAVGHENMDMVTYSYGDSDMETRGHENMWTWG